MTDKVHIGDVRPFAVLERHDKALVLKLLEESMKVYEIWVYYSTGGAVWNGELDKYHRQAILDRLADTIQACANIAAAFGVEDMSEQMELCERHNREMGRY